MGSSSLSEEEVRSVLRRSIDTWTGVECGGIRTGLEVTLLAELNRCTAASYFLDGQNVNSVIFVREGWSDERMHDPRAYAVTLVWHDPRSGEIWDADVEINEARGPYAVCPASGCEPGQVDLENTLTHEMGHYFGLAHTPDDPLATMWAMAVDGETLKRDLQPDDIAGLCAIYPPGTLPDTCDPTPRGGLGLDCQRPGCGCRVVGRGAPDSTPLAGLLPALALVVWRCVRSRARREPSTARRLRSAHSRRGAPGPSPPSGHG
jgi:hypothetical protein